MNKYPLDKELLFLTSIHNNKYLCNIIYYVYIKKC